MQYKAITGNLAFFSALLVMGSTVWAQNDIEAATNRAKLQDLSIHLNQRSEAAQKHAKDQARRKGWPIRKELSDGTLIELQRLSPTGMPIYNTTENIDAADTVSTDEVWTGGSAGLGLDGSGMTAGEWDGGAVLNTHQELTGRVTQVDGVTTTHYHATHVGGTLIASGVDANAKGMSHAADLDAYDWNNDEAEMATAGSNGLLLSNHSYGSITGWSFNYFSDGRWAWFGDISISTTEDYGFGFYSYWAGQWDQIAFDAPYYLIVKSAGNDRNDEGPVPGTEHWALISGNWQLSTAIRDADCGPAGYDCISYKGNAKNILTVGAAGGIPGGYPDAEGNNVPMTSFSGWGPTDDGRIKPDIAANGYTLWSSMDTSNTAYDSLSGTSMAAPNATGSLLLLQQHYQDTHSTNSMRAATLKALAIHTADEAGTADGPDYTYGWGLLNTKNAAEVISGDGGNSHRIIESTLNQGGSYEVQINSGGIGTEIKATLVWTDPPGTPVAASVDPADLMLVNDLDLRVTGNSSTYSPWILDPANPSTAATTGDNVRDNVEQVVIPLSADGIYTIQVNHKGTLIDDLGNAAPQSFSLIISTQPRSKYEIIERQDFESGLPIGWNVFDNKANGVVWNFDDPLNRTNRTGGTGKFAIADNTPDTGACIYDYVDTELRTNSLDLSGYSDVLLSFKSYALLDNDNAVNDLADVDLSTDGGSTWSNVWSRFGGNADAFVTHVVDISNLADNQPSVTLRYRLKNAAFCWFWQIDDVAIYGIPPTSVCGSGHELPAETWQMISLPCDPGANNTVADLFADDFTGAYDRDTGWVLFERNEDTDQYDVLALDSPLTQGKGYWIYSSNESTTLDTGGSATSLITSSECPQGCFEIPLTPPSSPDTNLYNLQGHPFPYSVNWADARVRVANDGNSPFTPSGADTAGYLSKIFNTYNGNGYDPYDDVTPGMEGVLGVYDGFWVEALDNTLFSGNLTLLIPPEESSGIILASQKPDAVKKESFLLAENTTVTEKYPTARSMIWSNLLLDWLIPQAHAAPVGHHEKIPPGVAKRDAHRTTHEQAVAAREEWYIRLTVEAPDEGMKDRGNVLGQLQDSEYGYDHHDLKELPPFGSRYLTVVFPHPDWVDRANDYASDFHPVSKKNRSDSWSFEVRTDDPERELSLSWAGLNEVLDSSWLVDEETGKIIEVADVTNHTFVIGSTARSFTWHYSGKEDKKRK